LKQDLPFVGLLGAAIVAGCAAVAYLLTGGLETATATAVAVAAGVLGQIVLVALIMRHNERNEAISRRLARDIAGFHSEVRRKTEGLQARLDQVDEGAKSQTAMIASGFADLKNSYSSLQAIIQMQVSHSQTKPLAPIAEPELPLSDELQEHLQEPDPKSEIAEDGFADQVLFALEPIVDVQTGRTAHYRMHLSMMSEGEELPHDKLLHYAGRVGKRAELDILALRESFTLLERLRQRDPELNIFVGLGAETLADGAAVAQIEAERSSLGENSSGVVFEMTHAMLAGISEAGLEGLARLARAGAHFSLTQISVNGLDLHAMNTLNVRYVGLPASAIDVAGPSTSLIGFAQMARLSRVSLIVTGLNNPALMGKFGSVARLACGPSFASPRRVKRDLARAQSSVEMAA